MLVGAGISCNGFSHKIGILGHIDTTSSLERNNLSLISNKEKATKKTMLRRWPALKCVMTTFTSVSTQLYVSL